METGTHMSVIGHGGLGEMRRAVSTLEEPTEVKEEGRHVYLAFMKLGSAQSSDVSGKL